MSWHKPIFAVQVEGRLDAWLGPTSSSLARLLLGLLGCTLVAGAFPFVPSTHASLLWTVAALGTVRDRVVCAARAV